MNVKLPSPRVSSGVFPLGLSLVIASLLHLIWFSIPINVPQKTTMAQPPVVTAFLRELPGGWSPTLFSLPSPTGFSGAIKQSDLQVAPPLQSPLHLTESIRLSSTALPPTASSPFPSFSDTQTGVFSSIFPFPEPEPTAVSGWLFQLEEEVPFDVRISRLPQRVPDEVHFEVRGQIFFDESGRLESLLIDPPHRDTQVFQEAVQVLRRLQAPNSDAGRPYRFRFSYTTFRETP